MKTVNDISAKFTGWFNQTEKSDPGSALHSFPMNGDNLFSLLQEALDNGFTTLQVAKDGCIIITNDDGAEVVIEKDES